MPLDINLCMTIELVSHHMVTGTKIVYCRRVKEIHQFSKMTINNDTLKMLSAREQLMEDMDMYFVMNSFANIEQHRQRLQYEELDSCLMVMPL